MIRSIALYSLVMVMVGTGCQSGQRKPYTNDPLLRQRPLVKGTARTATVVQMPLDEPLMPHAPRALAHAAAYQTARVKDTPAQTVEPPLTADGLRIPPVNLPTESNTAELPLPMPTPPVDVLGPPPPALPERTLLIPEQEPTMPMAVIEEKVEPSFVSTPTPETTLPLRPESGAPPVQVEGLYGHGPNYAWVQGTLDQHYRGHLNIRYCDPSKEDEWGGKVRLVATTVLEGLNDGDTVFVEGEVLPAKGDRSTESRDGYPSYRVHKIWLVKKGK